MATFTAIKNRGGGRGALGGVTRYVGQKEKTLWEDLQLVTGWNCTAQSALSEMQLTKERFRKIDGRQYYHFVQSFSEADGLTPQEAHAIGLELARREFPDFEVLVATHVDTEHLHNHLVVNSVSFRDGRKLHQSAADLLAHRLANDEICAAHSLEILPPPQKLVRQKRVDAREYRSAAKGESWKFRLMNTIEQCMMYAASREEFLSLMRSEGYAVCWIASRKYITYTTPQGMRCRDDRLHENKYRKEQMEREFRIRAGLITGGVEAAEPAGRAGQSYTPGVGGTAGAAGGSGGQHGGTGGPVPGDFHPGGEPPHPGSVGGAVAGGGGAGAEAPTGWEEERAAFLAAQAAEAFAPAPVPGAPAGPARAAGLVGGLVQLEHALERAQDSGPVADSTLRHAPVDHKAREQQRQKRLAMGHKADDHEEEPVWKLTP